MLIPLSWLKEYVPVKHNLKDLLWKMTEAGLTTESYKEIDNDKVLDVEVTANRPDWMSVIGIAREIAAIDDLKIKLPEIKNLPAKSDNLPITVNNDYELCPRFSALTISGVKLGKSFSWMQERLIKIGLHPINNLVDITNYVMFERGTPIHVFDYDQLKNNVMNLTLSSGGEKFTSVDNKTYVLPKNAIIFKSGKEVVDLCGIKGGLNSGVSDTTKNILLLVPVYNGTYIRKTSQKLSLMSDASRIFERGADAGATLDTLKRVVNLTLESAGGKIASEIIDDKKKSFKPWKLKLNTDDLNRTLGISIPVQQVVDILSRLNLSPELTGEIITCKIPTYRGDLKIEEDLIEEVARIYGYSNFPRSLPAGSIRKEKVPYYYDRNWEMKLKQLMVASGYSEIRTVSLVSKDLIEATYLNTKDHIRLTNPVSRDYEYLRSNLLTGLLSAVKLNLNETYLRLFEYGKVYFIPLETRSEPYLLAAIEYGGTYRNIKGTLDLLLSRLNITDISIKQDKINIRTWYPQHYGVIEKDGSILGIIGQINPQILLNFGIKAPVFGFELHSENLKKVSSTPKFISIGKYPAQIEDVTLVIPSGVAIAEVISLIKESDTFIKQIDLIDIYDNAYTFRIRYRTSEKTLSDSEVEDIRKKFLKDLKDKKNVTAR